MDKYTPLRFVIFLTFGAGQFTSSIEDCDFVNTKLECEFSLDELPSPVPQSVTEIVMRYNNLPNIAYGFQGLENLIKIDLTENGISNITRSFVGCINLRTIILADNEISDLADAFDGLDLEVLDLTHNKLTTLSDTFGGLRTVKDLRLDGNDLRCTCQLEKVFKRLGKIGTCNDSNKPKQPCDLIDRNNTVERNEEPVEGPVERTTMKEHFGTDAHDKTSGEPTGLAWTTGVSEQTTPNVQRQTTPRSLTPCEQLRKSTKLQKYLVKDIFIPECLEDGSYKKVQCSGETEDSRCWCVNDDGLEIHGTFEKYPLLPDCENERNEEPVEGPSERTTMQKHFGTDAHDESSGEDSRCWCLNDDGIEIRDTSDKYPSLLDCENERNEEPVEGPSERTTMQEHFGTDAHDESSGEDSRCWCLNDDGIEIRGTSDKYPSLLDCENVFPSTESFDDDQTPNATLLLQDLLEDAKNQSNPTLETTLKRSVKLEKLVKKSSNLDASNVAKISQIIDNISKVKNITTEISHNVLSTVSNVITLVSNANITTSGHREAGVAETRLIRSINTILMNIVLNGTNWTFQTDNLKIEVEDMDEPGNYLLGVRINNFKSNTTASNDNVVLSDRNDVRTASIRGNVAQTGELTESIILPFSVIDGLVRNRSRSEPVRVSTVVFTDTNLFRQKGHVTSSPTKSYKLNSKVISATILVGKETVTELKEKVVVAFQPSDVRANGKPACVYWDTTTEIGQWATEGCFYNNSGDGYHRCQCDHLTSFAVLMTMSGKSVNTEALIMITNLGLGMSIICVTFTLLSAILVKKLRQGKFHMTLLNLCVALLGSWLVFLVGIRRTESYYGCIVIASLLHYFIIVAFMWMLVAGYLQYLRFVRLNLAYIFRFTTKAMLLAWDIWLVGSSILYWAYRRARARSMPNLNFQDQGYRLQWFGQRGMHWHELVPKLQKLIEHRIPPKYLVIHLGGNDLTSLSSTELCSAIASQIAELHQWLCHTTIIWSDILPRFQWWGSIVPRAIDKKRKRVNRAGRRAAAVHSGRIIQHVELKTDTPGFFRDDGVHLSDVGNDFFLNTLQGALETFISSDTIIFS